jgi:2-polyprenyl-3-methyl-5-hydroxy-6-metoxy-1,4-benzoquinol methylase
VGLFSSEGGSREFFDSYSRAFDRIYSQQKSAVADWIDRHWRSSMNERLRLTLDFLRDEVKGKRVLDIGCGPGRYAVELARAGAGEVVGVDEAANMIALARDLAREQRAEANCRFVQVSFEDFSDSVPYDYAIGLGLFDYVMEPTPFLRKVREMTRSALVASFPVRWHWLTPQRKLRYRLRHCPLRFYTEGEIRSSLAQAGFGAVDLRKIERDYFAIAHVR